MHNPTALTDALVAALAAGAIPTVESHCVPGAFAGPVRGATEAFARGVFGTPSTFGTVVLGDRAVGGVAVHGDAGVLGKLWLLLVREQGAWRLADVVKPAGQAGLFLRGELEPRWPWRSAPPHDGAREWAQALVDDLVAGRRPAEARTATLLRPLSIPRSQGITGGAVESTLDLAPLRRAASTFSLTTPHGVSTWFATLEVTDAGVLPLMLARQPSDELVFHGIAWDRDLPGEPEALPRRRRR